MGIADTYMGKLLLTWQRPEELDTLLDDRAFSGQAGPSAVHSRAELDERLAWVREQGYSVQDQELAQGLRSISAPVFMNGDGPLAAMDIAVATARHDVELLETKPLPTLAQTARELTTRLRAL